jgi:hypothetical protein
MPSCAQHSRRSAATTSIAQAVIIMMAHMQNASVRSTQVPAEVWERSGSLSLSLYLYILLYIPLSLSLAFL